MGKLNATSRTEAVSIGIRGNRLERYSPILSRASNGAVRLVAFNFPMIHSDPQLPECAPGETVRVRGRLWFE